MSSDQRRTNAVPSTLTATSTRCINPPKRFLDFPAQTAHVKKATPPSSSASQSSLKSTEPKEFSSPPKLIRIPQIALTRIDAPKSSEQPLPSSSDLPPLPPLIRMPISTRKEKRSLAAAFGAEEPEESKDEQKPAEPSKKRARVVAVSTKVGESTSSSPVQAPSTPRKIIQEIFGPDKSKRAKGKGRKRKRGPPSPKKKSLSEEPEQRKTDAVNDEVIAEEELEETQSSEVPIASELANDEEDGFKNDTENIELKDDECEEKNPQNFSMEVAELVEVQEEAEINTDGSGEAVNDAEPASKEMEKEVDHKPSEEDQSEVKQEADENEKITPITGTGNNSSLPLFWGTTRRKAKTVAKEKLKRLSQSEDGTEAETNNDAEKSEPPEEDSSDPDPKDKETNAEPAEIRSRRSTTEGSSKSGSSTAPGDSESSVGCGHGTYSNKHLMIDRQRLNPTPLSLISEDDFNYGKERHDDGTEFQEQKDSDVDSTYSWKPVRAAAAAALEQVTKKQGSGSTGQPGDAETKAAQAAERRARKVMRHRGRSRRTLTFKSSSSKQFTTGRVNRYTAQPVVASVVYDHGSFFQRGDIVTVELADGSFMYGQVKGILLDHRGEIAAGIRWISPKHPLFGQVKFHPRNYQIRYDLPERLIKLEYVNFVMHCNLDYFNGHPSFTKIEKGAVFTRLGKNMYGHLLGNDSDSDSDEERNKNSVSSNSNSSQNNSKKNCRVGKKIGGHEDSSSSSNCSTDIEEMSEDEVENQSENGKSKASKPNEVVEDNVVSMRDDEVEIKNGEDSEVKESGEPGEKDALKELVCDETLDDEMEEEDRAYDNDPENSQIGRVILSEERANVDEK